MFWFYIVHQHQYGEIRHRGIVASSLTSNFVRYNTLNNCFVNFSIYQLCTYWYRTYSIDTGSMNHNLKYLNRFNFNFITSFITTFTTTCWRLNYPAVIPVETYYKMILLKNVLVSPLPVKLFFCYEGDHVFSTKRRNLLTILIS